MSVPRLSSLLLCILLAGCSALSLPILPSMEKEDPAKIEFLIAMDEPSQGRRLSLLQQLSQDYPKSPWATRAGAILELARERDQALGQYDRLKQQIDQYQDQLIALQKQLDRSHDRMEGLREQRGKIEDQISSLEQEKLQLSEKLEQLKSLLIEQELRPQ